MALSKLHVRFKCAVGLILGIGTACLAAASPSLAAPPANYTLKWGDDFQGVPTSGGGRTVDSTKWWWRMGHSAQSVQLPTNVSLDGAGNMNIANKAETVPTIASYTGGGLVSQAAFRYGYFEVQAQTPVNSGWHTAFWLSSVGVPLVSYNLAPAASFTEIDAFEIDSQTASTVSTGWFSWSNYGATKTGELRCSDTINPGFNTSAGMHTYGLEWTEAALTYFIDGTQVCTQPYTPTTGPATPVNIWLTSIAYSGMVTAPAGGKATFANPAYYVRDYYVNPGDTGYFETSGGWLASTSAGFSQQPVRYTCTIGHSSLYTPNILTAGNYKVMVYQIITGSMDTATVVTVNTATGPVTLPAGTLPTTGVSRWVDLGTYALATGPDASVSFQAGNNCIRSSMVKFVRQ